MAARPRGRSPGRRFRHSPRHRLPPHARECTSAQRVSKAPGRNGSACLTARDARGSSREGLSTSLAETLASVESGCEPRERTRRVLFVHCASLTPTWADARIVPRLFRKGSRVCQPGRSRWVSRSEERRGLGGGERDGPDRAFAGPFQAPAVAIWWLWSLSRLWVAVINRHSARAADLPRRWKRSIRRLNFVCPNTGSIIAWRLR
jgi:hypothetical protein